MTRPGQLPPAGPSAQLLTRRARRGHGGPQLDVWMLPDGLLVCPPATPGVPVPGEPAGPGSRADAAAFDLDAAVLHGQAVWLPWSWLWFARLSAGPRHAALLVRTVEAERHRLRWPRSDPATPVLRGVLPGKLGPRFVVA